MLVTRPSVAPSVGLVCFPSFATYPSDANLALCRRRNRSSKTLLPQSYSDASQKADRGTPQLVQRKCNKVKTLIQDSEELVLYDTNTQSMALAIWRAVSDIPPHQRTELLNYLGSKEIKKLWNLAQGRYSSTASEASDEVQGSRINVRDEFPRQVGQIGVFMGKAAVPVFSRFRKLFFITSKSELYGHVDVGLAKALYPLYFRCSTRKSIFPGGSGPTDMQLEYLPLKELDLAAESIPERLPQPKEPRWPFSGNLVDYMRAVGPGVLVGRGWKQPHRTADPHDGSGFLYFLLAKDENGSNDF